MYREYQKFKGSHSKTNGTFGGRSFFRVMRDIQGLDIVLSLQKHDCYTLPYKSMFRTINLIGLIKKLARRKTIIEELVTQRKFKKIFGLYGYKILNLCFMSVDDFVSESRYSENMTY